MVGINDSLFFSTTVCLVRAMKMIKPLASTLMVLQLSYYIESYLGKWNHDIGSWPAAYSC